MNKKVIFDVQILQTPALFRGMGHYVLSLLKAIDDDIKQSGKNTEILLILNSQHELSSDIKNLLDTYKSCRLIKLPLLVQGDTKYIKNAWSHNKTILNDWILSNSLQGSDFVISALFQTEIYPVFPDAVRKHAIMYDVIPLQMFNIYHDKMRWENYLTRFTQVYEADKLLCISKTTANDLAIYTGVSTDNLELINGGPAELSKPEKPAQTPTKPFILMPTGNDVRKNNDRAIRAFEQFRAESGGDFELVITSFFTDIEQAKFNSLSPNIRFTGMVSNQELAWYYLNCEALLFPSTYEGLGMPIIEAMHFNKPIAASRIEVFEEISSEALYYFDPNNQSSMVRALWQAIQKQEFNSRKALYKPIIAAYTWKASAKATIDIFTANNWQPSSHAKKHIAVVGPVATGVSAIGKFIAELHPEFIKHFDITYYFEKSPIDKPLRPDIMGHVTNYKSIYNLTDSKINSYDAVIYHVGNSNHHTLTAARALLRPDIVVLHDLNIENVYKDMEKRQIIDSNRLNVEKRLSKPPANFIQSLIGRQKTVIVHSKYGRKTAENLTRGLGVNILNAPLSIGAPKYPTNTNNAIFTIGLAGILADIKGVETIEKIAVHPDFAHDRFVLFGLNFAEPGLLDKLRELPNVEIITDLTDFEFQENVRKLDVFVNYRKKYQGEASRATLEAMRFGVPVVVRSDFGWYAELPDGAVIKVKNEDEIIPKLKQLKQDEDLKQSIHDLAIKTITDDYAKQEYAQIFKKLIEDR